MIFSSAFFLTSCTECHDMSSVSNSMALHHWQSEYFVNGPGYCSGSGRKPRSDFAAMGCPSTFSDMHQENYQLVSPPQHLKRYKVLPSSSSSMKVWQSAHDSRIIEIHTREAEGHNQRLFPVSVIQGKGCHIQSSCQVSQRQRCYRIRVTTDALPIAVHTGRTACSICA